MKHLISLLCLLLLPACVFAQTSGQNVIQKKNASAGFSYESFTLGNSQLIGRTSAGVLNGLTLGSGLSLSGTTLSASGSSLTIGTTAITGGTSGHVLYNNAGTLGGLATSAGGNGATDEGKIPIYDASGSLTASWFQTTASAGRSSLLASNGILITEGANSISFVAGAITGSNVLTLPNATGTLITSGDTGTVTPAMLAGSIALSKLSTTGTANSTTYLRGDGAWTAIDLSSYLTTATAASTYQPLNAKITSIGALANSAGVLTNNGSGTFSYTATTTGGNGDADSGKIALFNAEGGINMGTYSNISGNTMMTWRIGLGNVIAAGVDVFGQVIYAEVNGTGSDCFHAHITANATGENTGFDVDLTGGTGINYGYTVLANPTHYALVLREKITSTEHDRFVIDAQGEHTWYANGTTLTTGTNKTSLLIETPSGTGAYTLKAGRTGDIVSTGDTGTVTNAMLAGSIAASKLVGTDITTVGTITTGTWQGSIIAPAYLGTGTSITTKYLRGDGTWQTIAGGGDALTTNPLSQFAATTSAQFAGVINDETGTGSVVLASSPTLTTPNLGTPSAATLTNATGLPVSTGISGLGTGVATWLATPSSANFASALTDETGTGAVVLASSPTLTTPNLGTPSALTLTNATGLPLSTGVTGTLPIANGGTGQTSQTAAFDALAPTTTKGDLIVSNGSDNIRVPVGATNGHVLTVDSAEASGVKWAAASGGGSGGNWVLISTTTISGSPSALTFTFSGSYRKYRLELENVYCTSDGYMLRMRTSTDGGSTFDSGAANYGYAYGAHGTYGPTSTTGTYIETSTNLVGSATDEGLWGEIDFFDPLNASLKTFARWMIFGRIYNSAAANVITGAGYRDSAADVDTVQLYFSTGNFGGGKIRLFGWSE